MNLLLRGILSKPWAIDERFVGAHAAYIASLFEGQGGAVPDSIKFSGHYAIEPSGLRSNTALTNAPKGSIAVIELQGPLMKYDQECGPAGTASIVSWIKQADTNPNIDGIILKVDSPGGTVDGTEELARTIRETRKPVVGFVDGMAASAAYWAVSQADEIIANGKTSEAGSIGTMASWADMKPIFEKAGVRFHEVYASQSTDKNRIFRDAMKGEYDGLIAELDQLNDVFQTNVRKARPNVSDKVMTGGMYLSTEAKKLDLIDSIGSMDDAVKAIQRLKSTRNMSKNKTAEQFPQLCAALGFTEGFEATEEGVHLNMESIQAIEHTLAQHTQQAADLTASVQALTQTATETAATISANADTIASLQQQVSNLQQENQTLRGQRASNGSAPIGGTDNPPAGEGSASPYVDDGSQALLDQYAHR